jgi:Bacterial HORMA domain family 1
VTATYTASQTSTFSEARARDVMRRVLGDFMSVASAGLIERETILGWHEDVEYAVLHEAVHTFQLQFTRPDGKRPALSYEVRDDGTVLEASRAGGLDLYALPPGTTVSICIVYRQNARKLEEVRAYLARRRWEGGGALIEGNSSRDRAYSKNGFGITRNKVGDWE